jgi:hypothetical protein
MTMTGELQNQEKVKIAFDKYVDSLTKTTERRELWKTETKEKIYEILILVENSFKFQWHVQRIEVIENYQTINISFNSMGSGLIETTYDEKTNKPIKRKSFIKHGGYLAYCQSFNGKINVVIGFPYIEEWVDQMDLKVIATLEPSQITETIITEHLICFLQSMSEWEGKDRNPVGF